MNKDFSGYTDLGTVMTNFDHTIKDNAEEELKKGNTYGSYTAWNFHGSVFFENGKFKCQICVYGMVREMMEADSLDEIMTNASKKYGGQ